MIANKCDGSCGQGEGDCDWNSDCLPGLICEWDWWWGTDYCEAGKIFFIDWQHSKYSSLLSVKRWIVHYLVIIIITSGPDTTNFEWGPWGEFRECEGKCGEMGERIRHRPCIPPTNGGYPCPAEVDSESEVCEMASCPGKW